MEKYNIFLEAKSLYGRRSVYNHGCRYNFVKIVEKPFNSSEFLIMIKSNDDGVKLLVNIEGDNDFIVRFN